MASAQWNCLVSYLVKVSYQGVGCLPLKATHRRRSLVQNKQAGLHVCLVVNSITMTKMPSIFNGQRLKYGLPLEGECGRVMG
jgi:hypothetical protein